MAKQQVSIRGSIRAAAVMALDSATEGVDPPVASALKGSHGDSLGEILEYNARAIVQTLASGPNSGDGDPDSLGLRKQALKDGIPWGSRKSVESYVVSCEAELFEAERAYEAVCVDMVRRSVAVDSARSRLAAARRRALDEMTRVGATREGAVAALVSAMEVAGIGARELKSLAGSKARRICAIIQEDIEMSDEAAAMMVGMVRAPYELADRQTASDLLNGSEADNSECSSAPPYRMTGAEQMSGGMDQSYHDGSEELEVPPNGSFQSAENGDLRSAEELEGGGEHLFADIAAGGGFAAQSGSSSGNPGGLRPIDGARTVGRSTLGGRSGGGDEDGRGDGAPVSNPATVVTDSDGGVLDGPDTDTPSAGRLDSESYASAGTHGDSDSPDRSPSGSALSPLIGAPESPRANTPAAPSVHTPATPPVDATASPVGSPAPATATPPMAGPVPENDRDGPVMPDDMAYVVVERRMVTSEDREALSIRWPDLHGPRARWQLLADWREKVGAPLVAKALQSSVKRVLPPVVEYLETWAGIKPDEARRMGLVDRDGAPRRLVAEAWAVGATMMIRDGVNGYAGETNLHGVYLPPRAGREGWVRQLVSRAPVPDDRPPVRLVPGVDGDGVQASADVLAWLAERWDAVVAAAKARAAAGGGGVYPEPVIL